MVTLDVPEVSADVFITLVLALLPVATILTAGVDMLPLNARLPTRRLLCVVLCVRKIVFLIPYSYNFHPVNKKTVFNKEQGVRWHDGKTGNRNPLKERDKWEEKRWN